MSDVPVGAQGAGRGGGRGAEGPPPESGAGIDWSGTRGARAFAAVEAATDWLLGYPFVFRALAPRVGGDRLLVDYGCGPGRVADLAARTLGARVVGVDTSAQMLALARAGASAVAEFLPVEDGRVTGLPDGCADAVMCNHVLASLPSEEAVLAVLTEIRRLLRRGAPVVLLSTDPACAGIEYASLQVGRPGAAYGPGDGMPLWLRLGDGSWQEVRNHAWPPGAVAGLLERAGFAAVSQHRPTVAEALAVADPAHVQSRDWAAERARPPLVVTTALAV
ncbi:class I SAM-dependent methyltransferase [Streptomyces sp. NPDC086023]|uniref:class I SAM-dependent methyltransferase n=1 Tax=Streptomyces sp. NPDC086023 TaxID=3365746 RepID=UPI0037D133E8